MWPPPLHGVSLWQHLQFHRVVAVIKDHALALVEAVGPLVPATCLEFDLDTVRFARGVASGAEEFLSNAASAAGRIDNKFQNTCHACGVVQLVFKADVDKPRSRCAGRLAGNQAAKRGVFELRLKDLFAARVIELGILEDALKFNHAVSVSKRSVLDNHRYSFRPWQPKPIVSEA